MLHDIVERKNNYLDYKKKKFKKSKNEIFLKGIAAHGFGPKLAIFPTLFF